MVSDKLNMTKKLPGWRSLRPDKFLDVFNLSLNILNIHNSPPALVQGVVVRTNSRDTIYQAEISPVCDKPAPHRSEALRATASRAV